MTSPARGAAIVAAALLAALLSGCAVANPAISATPTSASPTKTLTGASEPAITPTIPGAVASATPSGTPSTPGKSTLPANAGAQLQPTFTGYVATLDHLLQGGGSADVTYAMKAIMTGSALDAATKTAAEYKKKGWKQVGTTMLESFSPGDINSSAGTAIVDFCTNSSAVTVKDGAGVDVPPADPTKRSLGGTAKLVYSGGMWRVASLTGLTPIESCP